MRRTSKADLVPKLRKFFRPWQDVLPAFLFGSQVSGKTFQEFLFDLWRWRKEVRAEKERGADG